MVIAEQSADNASAVHDATKNANHIQGGIAVWMFAKKYLNRGIFATDCIKGEMKPFTVKNGIE